MSEQQEFLDYIAQHPKDSSARLVYADWLEEHDQLEEADRQRKYAPAEKWLREFAGRHLNGYEEEIEITYEEIIQAGHNYFNHGEYYTQHGGESLRDEMWHDDTVKTFWENWSVVTGIKVPEEKVDSFFSCSC